MGVPRNPRLDSNRDYRRLQSSRNLPLQLIELRRGERNYSPLGDPVFRLFYIPGVERSLRSLHTSSVSSGTDLNLERCPAAIVRAMLSWLVVAHPENVCKFGARYLPPQPLAFRVRMARG